MRVTDAGWERAPSHDRALATLGTVVTGGIVKPAVRRLAFTRRGDTKDGVFVAQGSAGGLS